MITARRFAGVMSIVLPLMLAACAPATVEKHSNWYWGVAAVAMIAAACLLLEKAGDAIARHTQRNEHDETDEAGA